MTQTVIVTGATGGIGKAICHHFKEHGYFVIASDRINTDDLACDVFVNADLQKLCQIAEYREQTIKEFCSYLQGRGLNALINNAAVQIVKSTDELTIDDWRTTLDVNLLAPFLLTQFLLPKLESVSGSVVNIASIHAQLTKPQFVCYATSKAALVGLTKSMAVDLGPRIRINAICPAAVETPMLVDGFKGKEDFFKELSQKHPLNRLAKPEEVAYTAYFLVSQQSAFMTGESLNLCGGISGRLNDPV